MELPAIGTRKRPRGLAKELVDALTERIRKRQLRPGDKLPTEFELIREYGVSRTVVREAVFGLQSAGLVETKHGIGTFVLEPPASPHFRLDRSNIPTAREVLSMLELRIGLESEAAALAAERRTEAHVKSLRAILTEFKAALQTGQDAAEPDFKFHLTVAEATANHFFAEIMAQFGTSTIPRTRVSLLRSSQDRAAYLGQINREHERICEAIAKGDPRSASKSMRAHLSASRDRLRKAQEEAQG